MRTTIVSRLPNVDDYAQLEIQDESGFIHYTIIITAGRDLFVMRGKDFSRKIASIEMPIKERS